MTRSVTYKLEDLNEERIEDSFYEAELQKTEQEMFRIEKVLRRDKEEWYGSRKVGRIFI